MTLFDRMLPTRLAPLLPALLLWPIALAVELWLAVHFFPIGLFAGLLLFAVTGPGLFHESILEHPLSTWTEIGACYGAARGTPLAPAARLLLSWRGRKGCRTRLESIKGGVAMVRLGEGMKLRLQVDPRAAVVRINIDANGGNFASWEIPFHSWKAHKFEARVPPHLLNTSPYAEAAREAVLALAAFIAGQMYVPGSAKSQPGAPAKGPSAEQDEALRLEDTGLPLAVREVLRRVSGAACAARRDPDIEDACAAVASAARDIGALARNPAYAPAVAPAIEHVLPRLSALLDDHAALAVLERRDLVEAALLECRNAVRSAALLLDDHLRAVLVPIAQRTSDAARILSQVSRAVDLTGGAFAELAPLPLVGDCLMPPAPAPSDTQTQAAPPRPATLLA